MAETLFRHYIHQIGLNAEVISRGLAAPVGRPPHQYAIQVAEECGIPISPDKKAEALSAADLRLATAIFVMNGGHRREIQQRYASASGKTFLLGHWQGVEIPDPVNEPPSVFREVWQQCEEGCKEWLQRMLQAGLLKGSRK